MSYIVKTYCIRKMIKDKKLKKIIHEVGLDNSLPDREVENIVISVFKSLHDIIRYEGDKSLRIMGWGLFLSRGASEKE